jgi:hypothetical protein
MNIQPWQATDQLQFLREIMDPLIVQWEAHGLPFYWVYYGLLVFGYSFFCPDTESQNWACPRTAQKPGNMANIYSPKLEMLEPSIFIFEMYPSMWIVRYTIM